MRLNINRNELYSAGLLLLIGIGTVAGSMNYDVRTLARMGPGYFPLMLGVVLIIIAALILATPSVLAEEAQTPGGEPQYRAWAFVVVAVSLFVILGKYGGLVPATFVLVALSALGDRSNSWKSALVLAAFITALAVGIFHFGLRLQFPLFTWG